MSVLGAHEVGVVVGVHNQDVLIGVFLAHVGDEDFREGCFIGVIVAVDAAQGRDDDVDYCFDNCFSCSRVRY